ncbi:hypothetical protein WDL1P1_00151 (plasmid) [Variovorax sp. WDL1]|nr:hypothetical protein CHC07_05642 [Variovorax sp. B4]VTU41886.1 hypothetical protein SRS16P1_00149 [Variovorax sp. SRS16]VTV17148.1 hypothetical protein WDL1P1_00151 [Variovorax sp. WDL1]
MQNKAGTPPTRSPSEDGSTLEVRVYEGRLLPQIVCVVAHQAEPRTQGVKVTGLRYADRRLRGPGHGRP